MATLSTSLALLFAGDGWPAGRAAFRRVAAFAITLGLGYTIFSKRLNNVICKGCVFSKSAPVVRIIDAGLSPILHWIVIPSAGVGWAMQFASTSARSVRHA